MADEITPQGPLGSPGGQLLQRGMNFLFGQPPKKGMVAPTAPQAVPSTPAPLSPDILGSGLAAQAGTVLQQRPQQIDAAIRNAGG